MAEKLLNLKEVCRYLGLLEQDVRSLVDRGEIPAYRLGGSILRFRKDQIDKIKAAGVPKPVKLAEDDSEVAPEEGLDAAVRIGEKCRLDDAELLAVVNGSDTLPGFTQIGCSLEVHAPAVVLSTGGAEDGAVGQLDRLILDRSELALR